MLTAFKLIQILSKLPSDTRIFIHVDEDESPCQPVWGEKDLIVKHVDYDIPHIGGFYGEALVLGTDE